MTDVQIVDFLEHHGVKGMKWGVRNKKSRVKKLSTDHKTAANLRKKKPHELSNKQLQKVNARMNLEQNYRRLNPGKVEAGHRAVKGLLGVATTATTAYTLIKSPAGQAFIKLAKKSMVG